MQNLILTFHGIGAVPAGVPEAERPYWMAEADFVSFIAHAGEDARRLSLNLTASFDDGNRSDLDIAAPALRQHGIDGLFFPCSGRIGLPGYLAAADIRTLADQGFVIGSHGINHLPWAELDAATLTAELRKSKADIETALGRGIAAAALPFGSYNRRVLAGLRQAGYQTVYSSDQGLAVQGAAFQRRWSYKVGMDFNLESLAKASRDPAQRVIGAAKHLVKSLR